MSSSKIIISDQGLVRALAEYYREYLKALVLFLTIAVSYPMTLVRIMPMYAIHRELFPKICSVSGLIAFALASSLGVLCWHRKKLSVWPFRFIQPRDLLLSSGFLALGTGVLAGVSYLPIFDASVAIKTAVVSSADLSMASETAHDFNRRINDAPEFRDKLALSQEMFHELRIDPGDWRDRALSSTSELPGGYMLLLLNTAFVILTEVGLFLLALCNVFIFARQQSRKTTASRDRYS